MDELFEELWSTQYRISGDQVQAKDWAKDFLDRHAHLLAAEIRAMDGRTVANRETAYSEAADLIDPAVK